MSRDELLWLLPGWMHDLILRGTGYRLVRIVSEWDGRTVRLYWTRRWPVKTYPIIHVRDETAK